MVLPEWLWTLEAQEALSLKAKDNNKKDKLDKIRQNIFQSKTDKEKKMWESILRKLLSEHDKLK